ncbi:MAG: single-stranded-DNA-specific exonuclease RecJ [Lachnospiraceae bacterium]|nr:single-stranded-DNA-specific exonuclease RecJ [Lachnospiraceae bacterium]
MEKWIKINNEKNTGIFRQWGEELSIDPLCALVIRNRGAEDIEQARRYLEGGMDILHDPFLLPDMDKAVTELISAIDEGEKIRIIGDYDVDGVTSTFILVKCITAAGGMVSYAIPDRLKDGYGINDDLVRKCAEDSIDLIITCDNGIAAASQIVLAKDLGINVIVTDHHQVPFDEDGQGTRREILPECLAVVDPHREGSAYPYKGICGAMVAYKYMAALLEKFPSEKLRKALEECIQFAALGTACDVMDLCDENRVMVREGLRQMEKTGNTGLKALMNANRLEDSHLSAYSLSFVIGPCINSTGRLESAKESVNLLLSDDYEKCLGDALRIRELNDSRKNMTQSGLKKAVSMIESENMLSDKVLVIYLPELHESIAGLVAGKIKESYNRPVLVITRGEDGLKGSGRSIPAYNMFEKMSEVKDLFTKFGGHAMAAGFSLEEENLGALKKELNERAGLTEEDLVREVRYDSEIGSLSYPSVRLIRDLEKIEPIGAGNPGALFATMDVTVEKVSRMGKEKQYGSLNVRKFNAAKKNNDYIRMTYFGDMDAFDRYVDEEFGPGTSEKLYSGAGKIDIDICYELKINNFRGNETVDYRLKNYRKHCIPQETEK